MNAARPPWGPLRPNGAEKARPGYVDSTFHTNQDYESRFPGAARPAGFERVCLSETYRRERGPAPWRCTAGDVRPVAGVPLAHVAGGAPVRAGGPPALHGRPEASTRFPLARIPGYARPGRNQHGREGAKSAVLGHPSGSPVVTPSPAVRMASTAMPVDNC